ncbi:MBL fold metallo-hydrolase [Pelomonas sp. Root1217]|uniref:MBL fold metallo-hydrolase n=1 Tax=Pelomonas sp. Root1217 TaxID=1736430 RepID=UPI001F3A52DF|nr:MBL fold metallo-hydrolase [Pelomonas sp. Root1217]
MTLRRPLLAGLFLGMLASLAPAQTPPAETPPPLELVVLGSGGPGATGRAGSAHVVLVDGVARVLVDAGPGSFARLGEAALPLNRLDIILLTHLHADHAGELPGIVKARAVSAGRPVTLRIFGPGGQRAKQRDDADFPSTRRFVDLLFGKQGAFGYLRDFSAPLTLQATNIAPTPQPRVLLDEAGLRITALRGHHRDAPAVIYRVEHGGKSIVFSGDIDAGGHAALKRLAQGCDALVFNTVVLDPPGSPEVLYTLHTAPSQIGAIAAAAGVGRLLLAHLVPAVERERAAVDASIRTHYAGSLSWAEDGLHLRP